MIDLGADKDTSDLDKYLDKMQLGINSDIITYQIWKQKTNIIQLWTIFIVIMPMMVTWEGMCNIQVYKSLMEEEREIERIRLLVDGEKTSNLAPLPTCLFHFFFFARNLFLQSDFFF